MRFRSRRRRKTSASATTTATTAPKQQRRHEAPRMGSRSEDNRNDEDEGSRDSVATKASSVSDGSNSIASSSVRSSSIASSSVHSSNNSRVSLFRTTAGVRESRKFFNLTTRSPTPTTEPGEEPPDDPLLDLEILLKQTWNIWAVSALFNFNVNDEVQLKQYGKKLREEVARILSKEDVSYEAKITVLDLQRPKETDHPVVMIQVIARVEERDKETQVYRGYLFSWRSEQPSTTESPILSNTTRLPLLLCRGTPGTTRAVHASLTCMFDCLLVALPATADDLAWLLLVAVSPGGGQNEAREHDEAHLEYALPSLGRAESITVKFYVRSLLDLWQTFAEERTQIDAEEIEKFHEILQLQVMEVGSLELGLCILHKIQLPSITISGGKMKVMNVEAMNTILTYLNEKALDALHINTSLLSMSK